MSEDDAKKKTTTVVEDPVPIVQLPGFVVDSYFHTYRPDSDICCVGGVDKLGGAV
jgi:hypothetical protein